MTPEFKRLLTVAQTEFSNTFVPTDKPPLLPRPGIFIEITCQKKSQLWGFRLREEFEGVRHLFLAVEQRGGLYNHGWRETKLRMGYGVYPHPMTLQEILDQKWPEEKWPEARAVLTRLATA